MRKDKKEMGKESASVLSAKQDGRARAGNFESRWHFLACITKRHSHDAPSQRYMTKATHGDMPMAPSNGDRPHRLRSSTNKFLFAPTGDALGARAAAHATHDGRRQYEDGPRLQRPLLNSGTAIEPGNEIRFDIVNRAVTGIRIYGENG
ncbi:hypothetical protein EVAR_43584_1 [Eumeta japonica]|uniref:Uncharacterized protein n=1 Tax=Eumeta variegata TaxID=151549 RepID=A0A4C1XHF7_EUMVA|nr:hypothetical protein EVAR_43584_1 [Eumeta japonica]